MSIALHNKVKALAKKKGWTKSLVLRTAIEKEVNKYD